MDYVDDVRKKRRRYYASLLQAALAENPDDPRHGTTTAYNRGMCRCSKCKRAARDYRERTKVGKSEQRKRVRAEMIGNPDDPRHGTANGYTSYGCRCDMCCAARAEKKNRERLVMETNPDDPRHGTYAGAVTGCSCDVCREARNWYNVHRKEPTGERAEMVFSCHYGDSELAMGTMREIAEAIGRRVETVNLYSEERYQIEHPDGWRVVPCAI